MKRIFIASLIIFSLSATSLFAQQNEEVRQVIASMFEGMKSKNTDLIKAAFQKHRTDLRRIVSACETIGPSLSTAFVPPDFKQTCCEAVSTFAPIRPMARNLCQIRICHGRKAPNHNGAIHSPARRRWRNVYREVESWCPRRDSNSHDLRRRFLKPLRLPFRHSGQRGRV